MVATVVPVRGGDPRSLLGGGFPAWPLPPDETGAGLARHLVKAVFAELGMPAATTYDAAVAVSELVTNVHVHAYGGGSATGVPDRPSGRPQIPPDGGRPQMPAGGGGPVDRGLPELWAYVRWHPRPEIVLKVYDSAPWRGPAPYGIRRPTPGVPAHGPSPGTPGGPPSPAHGPSPAVPYDPSPAVPYGPPPGVTYGPPPAVPYGPSPEVPGLPVRPAPDAECGRGLEVVDALAAEYGGEWGVHRTRSRLGAAPVPGKAVYLTVPIPSPPAPVRLSARRTAETMRALLTARALGPVQVSAAYGMAVLCVRAGTHVWVRERSISYCLPGHRTVRHPPYDGIEVVEQIVRHCAEGDGRRGM